MYNLYPRTNIKIRSREEKEGEKRNTSRSKVAPWCTSSRPGIRSPCLPAQNPSIRRRDEARYTRYEKGYIYVHRRERIYRSYVRLYHERKRKEDRKREEGTRMAEFASCQIRTECKIRRILVHTEWKSRGRLYADGSTTTPLLHTASSTIDRSMHRVPFQPYLPFPLPRNRFFPPHARSEGLSPRSLSFHQSFPVTRRLFTARCCAMFRASEKGEKERKRERGEGGVWVLDRRRWEGRGEGGIVEVERRSRIGWGSCAPRGIRELNYTRL